MGEYPDLPADVHHVQPTDYHTAFFKTSGLRSRLEPSDLDNEEIGFSVIVDGPYLALNAGTISDQGDQLYIFQSLTPQEARELASALEEAADFTQAAQESAPDDETAPETWLRRLINK